MNYKYAIVSHVCDILNERLRLLAECEISPDGNVIFIYHDTTQDVLNFGDDKITCFCGAIEYINYSDDVLVKLVIKMINTVTYS